MLRSKVGPERRERVIHQEIDKGVNVLICNPELVKTGLDLIAFPTLIFFEITFNLSTMLQAASRSYRLNQEEPDCEVIYMFHEGTMEQTAVQLMSRKQRAAKILTGDTGLTGLDALTEGESGFESALLDAITDTEDLIDPRDLFTQDAIEDEITSEDNAFWNVEVDDADADDQILPDFDPAAIADDDDSDAPETPEQSDNEEELIPVKVTRTTAPVPSTATAAQKHLSNLIASDEELEKILAQISHESSDSDDNTTDDDILQAAEEYNATPAPTSAGNVSSNLPPEKMKQSNYVRQYLEQFPS